MDFLPDGGHRWTRTLQLKIPRGDGLSLPGWHVVSLGAFQPQRFPDIVVTDADSRRLNLVTRRQHGDILASVLLATHLREFPEVVGASRIEGSKERRQLEALQKHTSEAVTEVSDARRREDVVGYAVTALVALTGTAPDGTHARAFRTALEQLGTFTYYLCWVRATPGEVVNLRVVFTTRDARSASAEPTGFFQWAWSWLVAQLLKLIGSPQEHRPPEAKRMQLYRMLGMAPLNYQFPIPSDSSTGSFYFTLQPPPRTQVMTMMGCGVGVGDNRSEVNSAKSSFHFHNAKRPAGRRRSRALGDGRSDRTIHAYLRPVLHEHKTIVGGAAINVLFAFFVLRGRFFTEMGVTAQTSLLVTPTVLTGIIAQRQRHYHAVATALQRGLLWLYLSVCVGFLITVAFSRTHPDGDWSTRAAGAIVAFAGVSTWIALLYLPLGHRFDRKLARTMRLWEMQSLPGSRRWSLDRLVKYDRSIQRYCDWAIGRAFVGGLLALAVMTYFAATGSVRAVGEPPQIKIDIRGPIVLNNDASAGVGTRPDTNLPPDTNPHRSTR